MLVLCVQASAPLVDGWWRVTMSKIGYLGINLCVDYHVATEPFGEGKGKGRSMVRMGSTFHACLDSPATGTEPGYK